MKTTSNNSRSTATLAQVLRGGGVNAPQKVRIVSQSALQVH